MNNQEKLAAVTELEHRLEDAMEKYVLGVRTKKSHTEKEALYDEVNKIKKEIRQLKTSA
jgi:hypothetical protein